MDVPVRGGVNAEQAKDAVGGSVQQREERPEHRASTTASAARWPSAVSVGYWRAIGFGTSSPISTWMAVSATSTVIADADTAVAGSSANVRASTGASATPTVACANAPRTRLVNVMPIWDAPT